MDVLSAVILQLQCTFRIVRDKKTVRGTKEVPRLLCRSAHIMFFMEESTTARTCLSPSPSLFLKLSLCLHSPGVREIYCLFLCCCCRGRCTQLMFKGLLYSATGYTLVMFGIKLDVAAGLRSVICGRPKNAEAPFPTGECHTCS